MNASESALQAARYPVLPRFRGQSCHRCLQRRYQKNQIQRAFQPSLLQRCHLHCAQHSEVLYFRPDRSMWFEIHELGVIIGKEDNLSYHQSRHSFGTFLISADIPIESIAKMMGHSNIRTTQGYARITDDKISKDMDKLMERRKKQSTGEKTNKSN